MALLAPLWLLGLASLAIPIVIHLRRRRIDRRVQVGSIRHLSGAATPRSRRLRIRDPWLLALRLAILAALVLALAEPVLRALQPRPARWALVTPDLADDTAFARHHPIIDSLRRAGDELHVAAPGFPALGDGTARSGRAARHPADLWSLVAEVDRKLPAGSRIAIVTSPRLEVARGRRPRVASTVALRVAEGRAPPSRWIDAGWATADSVSVRVGRSDAQGAAFELVRLPAGASSPRDADGARVELRPAGDSGWTVTLIARQPGGSLGQSDSLFVRRTSTAAVSILSAETRRAEARYLAAAFRAAAAALGVPLVLTVADASARQESTVGAAASRDWTVWLSDASVPERLGAGGGSTLLTVRGGDSRPGPPPPARSMLLASAGAALPAGMVDAATPRGGSPEPSVGPAPEILLEDGRGHPVLTRSAAAGGVRLAYAGRFEPASSDLVLLPAFPEMIARLWGGPATGLDGREAYDARRIAPSQLQPHGGVPISRDPADGRALRTLLLAVAAALFLMERLYVNRVRG